MTSHVKFAFSWNVITFCAADCGAGGSFDWVKNGNPSFELEGSGIGVKYAFAPELRPQSEAEGGQDIPPEEIYPSGEEIFAGVVTSVKQVYG